MIICIINQESFLERQVRDFIYCGDQWKIILRHLRRAVISHQVGGGVRGARCGVTGAGATLGASSDKGQ